MNSYQPNITTSYESYAFGMLKKSFSSPSYRYGYQGSEKDDEITGVEGAHITTFFREGDTRLAKWWSIDPKAARQPWHSPYSFMGGNPILNNDVLGDIIKIQGKFGFRLRTRLNLTLLRVVGPKEVRQLVNNLSSPETTPEVITINDKAEEKGPGTRFINNESSDQEIQLAKNSELKRIVVSGEEGDVRANNITALTNELQEAQSNLDGEMAEDVSTLDGKGTMSNLDVKSNETENLVRKRFNFKPRQALSHQGSLKDSKKEARNVSKQSQRTFKIKQRMKNKANRKSSE